MGYTRYWRRPPVLEANHFASFSAECETACHALDIPLREMVCDDDIVSFQGLPGCEHFCVARVSAGRVREGMVSEFCKTQGLPYDKAVERCLQILTQHFPHEVEIPEPS